MNNKHLVTFLAIINMILFGYLLLTHKVKRTNIQWLGHPLYSTNNEIKAVNGIVMGLDENNVMVWKYIKP